MSDMFLGSQTPLYQNVCIRRRSKSGKILEERHAKNRVTRLMLYGIGKFLLGHFNNSTPDKIYEFIPRYLALGTNVPGDDAASAGVTAMSTVNDTRLLNEIKYSNTTGASEAVKRVWIAERNMCKLNTKFSDPFIKVSIKTYISSNHYDGMSIGEAGLFSKEKDNNCLARVCFNPIIKNPNEVLDIQWDITLLSYGETKYPEKIEIENGSKIALPLRYTNKYFKEISLGLKLEDNIISFLDNTEWFECNESGEIKVLHTDTEYIESGWRTYLSNSGITDDLFKMILEQMSNSKLNDIDNPYYLVSNTQDLPIIVHFGNLYDNFNETIIEDNELAVTILFNEDTSYTHEDTKWSYSPTEESDNYIIYSPSATTDDYKIINNRFYKRDIEDLDNWIAVNAFLYNGVIVDINQEYLGYTYSDNNFYKSTISKTSTASNQYLNYSHLIDETTLLPDETKHLYQFDKYNTIQRTGYTIDFNDNQKIYFNDEYTDYHVSIDNYWVTGDYEKLIPIISPTDVTDRSVDWYIHNKEIAKINWDGVVTAWNLGETTAIATTSNDLRAKCIIDVVKESKFIPIDGITLDPTEITLIVDGDANQYQFVSAQIEPMFATNPTVNWSISTEIINCISIINLGNNKIKVVLNGTGNIGVGYITATSQSGKSAQCLVRVIYKADSEMCDCDDISHYQQEA